MRSAQGHVKEVRKGVWNVVVEFPRKPNGKRHQVSRTIRGTRKDAEKKKNELLLQAGYDIQSELTVTEYCDLIYLPMKEKSVKIQTFETYERRINNHIRPAFDDVRLVDLTPHLIRRWLESKSPKVAKECRRMLRMICQEAVYDDHLQSNPVDRVKPVKVERYDPDVLDAEDIEVYLWHFAGMRSEPAVLIALGCGLRRGEIVALNVEDINPVTGSIIIDDEIVPTQRHGDYQDDPKSHSSRRKVHMPQPLLERLLEILPTSGPVARNMNGTRIKANVLTHLYEKERDLLPPSVPRISLKNLRHSSLTLAYESTGDLEATKERAGHSNISITARYYVRPTGERDKLTAERMAKGIENQP